MNDYIWLAGRTAGAQQSIQGERANVTNEDRVGRDIARRMGEELGLVADDDRVVQAKAAEAVDIDAGLDRKARARQDAPTSSLRSDTARGQTRSAAILSAARQCLRRSSSGIGASWAAHLYRSLSRSLQPFSSAWN